MTLSIITVTYNSGKYLNDTLKSILNQNFPVEYILVDGGSTDNSLKIIKGFKNQFDGCLKWISEKDNGIYDAMNKGIRMATGDVIGFLNSDDALSSPDAISKQIELLEKSGADAVYGDVQYVKWDDLSSPVRYYSSAKFRRWKMRMGFMPAHPTFYCKKEIYEKYGLFNLDYKIAADFECLLRFIYVHHIKTVYNPMQVVTMRTGGASSSGWKSHKQIMKDHLKALHEHHIYSNVFILSLRYFFKVKDLIVGKLTRK